MISKGLISQITTWSVLILIALGLLTAWWAFPTREPVYQGKSLSAWLDQHTRNGEILYANPPPGYDIERVKRARAQAEAEIAIKHIGTNALPFLAKMVA